MGKVVCFIPTQDTKRLFADRKIDQINYKMFL